MVPSPPAGPEGAATRGNVDGWNPFAVNVGERRGGGLSDVLAWWGRELASLIATGIDTPTVTCEAHGVVVGGTRHETPLPLREMSADRLRTAVGGQDTVQLIIGRSLVFERSLSIPRAAKGELAGILSFEIERHTPYRAPEVLYVWRERPKALGGDVLDVDLMVVPKEGLQSVIAALEGAGIVPDRLGIASSSPDRPFLPLPCDVLGIKTKPMSAPLRNALLAVAVMAFVAAGMPFLRQQIALSDLRAEAETLGTRVAATAGERARGPSLQVSARAIVDAKLKALPATQILDTLSQVLPDGTWLRDVGIADGEVVIEGTTDKSAQLVDMLEAAPRIDGVRYIAPVTRELDSQERFGFAFTWSQGGQP